MPNQRPKLTEAVNRLRDASARVLGSQDGRWALVSTTLTASVALTVTLLSLSATPAATPRLYEPRQEHTALPYDLLMRLAGIRALPAIAAEETPSAPGRLYRNAGLLSAPDLSGPLDRMLAQERASVKPAGVETRTLHVDNGDTIMGMLQDAGVSSEDANAVVDAMKPLYSPRSIRSGQTFQAIFGSDKKDAAADAAPPQAAPADEDADHSRLRRLLSLSFAPTLDHQITVKLTAPDEYLAQDIQRKLEAHYQHAGATIDSSLYLSAMQAGIPAAVVIELIRMFSYEVDFQRDVHQGDSFEVFFNTFFTPEGQPAKPGDIMAATMTLAGKKHLLYRYESQDGVEYFDANGQSAKSMLMKTPVDGARISSGFGERLHPVLGYTRMHKGIDFAVPQGTPVMAAGSGTIQYAGIANGFGNLVIINHGNGYSTAYGHLSRFAGGMHAGAHVHQGDIVAYSGMTGIATGPHLHYEIRINNVQVNPASVKIASGRQLQAAELRNFFTQRDHIEGLMASLPVQHKLAQANVLRDTRD